MLFWSLHVHPLLDCPLLLSLSLTPMFLDSKIFQGPWPWDSCYSAASKPPTFVGHHTYARRGSGAAEPRMTWTTGMTQLWSCWSVGLERSGTVLDCFSILHSYSSYHISSHFITFHHISSTSLITSHQILSPMHADIHWRAMLRGKEHDLRTWQKRKTVSWPKHEDFQRIFLLQDSFIAILCHSSPFFALLIFWFSLVLNI